MGWSRSEAAVTRAEALSAPQALDPAADLVARHALVKQFGPALLSALAFEGSAAVKNLMAALDVIRAAYKGRRRKLPADVPLRFVPRRWRSHVVTKEGVSRAGYELCAFSCLHGRLQAGDVWVAGSTRFRAFDDYLLPRATFAAMRASGRSPCRSASRITWPSGTPRSKRPQQPSLRRPAPASCPTCASMRASCRSRRRAVTPPGVCRYGTPRGVKALRQALYDRLPRARITDVLLDVNAWTGFSDCSTHRRSGRACDDRLPFFGYRFAPRIRALKDRRLHLLPGMAVDPLLAHWTDMKSPIDVDHARAHWDELLRMATSIRSGTVTASAMLKKLSAYPRQNGLAVALRELGRLDRSLCMLRWLLDLDLRRRAQTGLNKGEARNALARAIFFCQLGELRDRTFENQVYRASGLNLVVAGVILWNTRYLELAAAELGIGAETMRHVAPRGWEHLSLTGDYAWDTGDPPGPGELRPLRSKPSLLAA